MKVRSLMAVAVYATVILTRPGLAQVIRPVRQFSTEGTVRSIRAGQIALTDRTGKSWQMHIATRKDGRVALGGSRVFLAPPTKVEIEGELGLGKLKKGTPLRFAGHLNEQGTLRSEPIAKFAWADEGGFKPGVKIDRKKKDDGGHVACVVSGTFESTEKNRLTLRMPRSRYASKGTMAVPLADDAKVAVKTRDLSKVREGDLVSEVAGVELNTGDLVVQQLKIRLRDTSTSEQTSRKTTNRSSKSSTRGSTSVAPKYEKLSDQKVAPRPVRRKHYNIQTDLSDRDAKILIDRLEAMLRSITRYYGRPQPVPVECYVVGDLDMWQADRIPEDAKKKIKAKQGLTKVQSAESAANRKSKAVVVYAYGDMGVVLHEAVHAYCHLAFGGTGPTWYSEGMAEVGQYWKDGQRAVDIDPDVIKYLKRTKSRKSLKEIIAPGEITKDYWKEYTWRWALCHLLANNPNYSGRFKELGIGLMTGRSGASLLKSYGDMAKQLAFEYDFFLRNVENGYRADLCAWAWRHKFEPVDPKGHKTVKLLAKAGWQPSVSVQAGVTYDYLAKGQWQIDGTGTKSSADGDKQGNGKLMAVVMKDFGLGAPISLGTMGKFKAPSTGDLYLRCGEAWSRIGDNSGGLIVHLRVTK